MYGMKHEGGTLSSHQIDYIFVLCNSMSWQRECQKAAAGLSDKVVFAEQSLVAQRARVKVSKWWKGLLECVHACVCACVRACVGVYECGSSG